MICALKKYATIQKVYKPSGFWGKVLIQGHICEIIFPVNIITIPKLKTSVVRILSAVRNKLSGLDTTCNTTGIVLL